MILITGGTGFLGKYIVQELLSEGHELKLLVRNPQNRKLPSWQNLVEIVDGDILDVLSLEKATEGVSQVIHSAALVSFWKKDRDRLMHVNVEGTANVVNACMTAGVEKLIHISSIAAIGRTSNGDLITEETPWNNSKTLSAYSLSKYRAELEVYRGIAEGLHAVMLNPSVILGAADNWDEGTAKMFSIIDKGLRFYNPGSTGFVGALDVAVACRLLLEKHIRDGERFLLSAENHSFKDLFEMMAKALDTKAPFIQLPALPTLWVGRISEWISYLTGKPPIISLASMRSGLLARGYDGSKITELGFTYTPYQAYYSANRRRLSEGYWQPTANYQKLIARKTPGIREGKPVSTTG